MLKELCLTSFVNGQSFNLINKIKKYLAKRDKKKELVYSFDKVGNFIIEKNCSGSKLATIIASLDEAALIVTSVLDDGRLAFDTIGIEGTNLIGKSFLVGENRLPAVVGFTPIHLQHRKNIEASKIKVEDLSLTIGAKTKEEALAKVSLGDYAVYSDYYKKNGSMVFASRLDNRASVWVALELLFSNLVKVGLKVVLTQVSKAYPWGASALSSILPSKTNIVLQTVASNDFPFSAYNIDNKKQSNKTQEVGLGKGSVLVTMDDGHISSLSHFISLSNVAQKLRLPIQVVKLNTKGEAALFANGNFGLPTITVGIPCRYSNSPISIINYKDATNTIRLLEEYLSS